MRVLEPITVTDAMLNASNVPETDYPVWASGTAYVAGNRVIRLSTHRIYEAIAPSTGQTPELDLTATYWLDIGATNRWRAFDKKLGDKVSQAGSLSYTITPATLVDSFAFFGIEASELTLIITDPTEGEIYNESFELIDNSGVIDAWTYVYEPLEYVTEKFVRGVPVYSGVEVQIILSSPETANVAEIVMGRDRKLGETMVGTGIGITDYSRKERDDFGNALILQRAYSDRVSFIFSFPTSDALRVKRILARLRATPAVFYAGEDTDQYGTTVFGFYSDFDIPLTTSLSFATMEVEGLT